MARAAPKSPAAEGRNKRRNDSFSRFDPDTYAETMISQTAPVSVPKVGVPPAARKETVLHRQLVRFTVAGGGGWDQHACWRQPRSSDCSAQRARLKRPSFYMIVGLVRPNSGRVIFWIRRYQLSDVQTRRLGMGYLPQKNRSFGG